MNIWKSRIAYDGERDWSQDGPRIYLDGELLGTIDITEAPLREECPDSYREECPYLFLNGEGDVSVPGGYHEWWDCEPDDNCPLLNDWIDALVKDLREPDNIYDICEDCETVIDLIDAFADVVPDCWHFPFIAAK